MSYERAVERMREMGFHDDLMPTRESYEKRSGVWATREQAREVIDREQVDPDEAVIIDCSRVAILAPSFAVVILAAWPLATLLGANEDVQAAWNVAESRRAR